MTRRRLRKSDLAIVKAVYREYRARGEDPDEVTPWSSPMGPPPGKAALQHVQRLREREQEQQP